jgi:hypothetical protein
MTDVVEKLKNDGEVAGRFEWAGHHDPDGPGTPGVLRWSPEDGATLQLIGPHERWPDDFISTGMTINGVTDDGGELTLFDAWISRMSMIPQRVISLKSSALLAGAQLSGDERWTSGAYRTAHLHEWLPETGLLPREYGADETAWPPKRLTIAWEPPTPHHINLPAGRLTLSHGMASPSRWGPEISIKTWLNAHAKPTEPMAIDELWRTFVSPLLALTTLASGRADGVTFERLTDPGAERAVEVIRMGDKIPMRGWREGRSWLFDARAFDEVGATVRTWYELYEKSYPAIAMFGQTLEAPNNYSSGRLVELYTALEVYSRACHHVRGENAADARRPIVRTF